MIGIVFSLVTALSMPFLIKASASHFLSLQVVTIWHFDELDNRIEELEEEVLQLDIEYNAKNVRPSKRKNKKDQMKSYCRNSSSVYWRSKSCREWRRNRR